MYRQSKENRESTSSSRNASSKHIISRGKKNFPIRLYGPRTIAFARRHQRRSAKLGLARSGLRRLQGPKIKMPRVYLAEPWETRERPSKARGTATRRGLADKDAMALPVASRRQGDEAKRHADYYYINFVTRISRPDPVKINKCARPRNWFSKPVAPAFQRPASLNYFTRTINSPRDSSLASHEIVK